ncbi:MAG: IPT/TIG domain-containing protein [Solirubrobacterales bacterium]
MARASATSGAVALALAALMLGAGAATASAAPPTVTSISPSSGPTAGGTPVTIKGTGFLAGAKVKIGSEATAVNVVSETEITATTAATAAGSDEVVVEDANGKSTSAVKYTYLPPPTVTSITPNQGPTAGGTAVKIKGTGFIAGATVKIGSEAAVVTVTAEEITARTPAGSGTPEVIVTDAGGSSTLGPTYAYVSAPAVVTGAASSVTQTAATLSATVNPNGGTVSDCHFVYGTSEAYGSSAPCTSLPGSGSGSVGVSAPVTGLAANTVYHFRIVTTSPGGTGEGADQTFTTLPNPPTIVTEAASDLAETVATLNATVNPNGGAVSSCKFEYGTTVAYGSTVPCSSFPGVGSSPVAVSAKLVGLAANTTYHFRVVATNSGGTNEGADQNFTTPPNTSTITITITPMPTPIVVHVTPPNSTFKTLGAVFNPTSHTITFTESVVEPGTFRWLLTFQNGKFGVFGATVARCKTGLFVRLGGKCRPSKIVFARGSSSVTSSGTVNFVLKPTPSALRALKNAFRQKKSLPVAMTLTFQSVRSSSPVSRLLALTVRTR